MKIKLLPQESQNMVAAAIGLCFLSIFASTAFSVPLTRKNSSTTTVEFIIFHNNDMHSRFEQTSINSGKCLTEEANRNKCYGGFARTAHEIKKYRETARNGGLPVIYLNAGDTYTGTPWFTVYKDNITAAFLNKLAPDAISLGNHELDEGVGGLVPFLKKVQFPVLAANLDLSKTPELIAIKNLQKSFVLEVNGTKVGVIGYLTPETKKLVPPNNIVYQSEVEAINEEAKKLKAIDVNIIIALGHSGYRRDQEIARDCPEVDIVIGGHSNTFLYNGKQPSWENVQGPYPTIVKQLSGKTVPVVQAYAFTKYLGKLHVQFDSNGSLIEFDGQPILLNGSIERDDDVLKLLEVYRPKIIRLETTVIGNTSVDLDGSFMGCRKKECTMGNMITDAMIYARFKELSMNRSDALIAFIEGGGIRNSIPAGPITENDLLSVLPFGNDIYLTKVAGKTIFTALEQSLWNRDRNGGFLQMTGVQVVYDLRNKNDQRVVSAKVMCAECTPIVYKTISASDENLYNVIVPEYLLNGGDGHYFNSNLTRRLHKIDIEILSQYIEDHGTVAPKQEGRITIVQ